MAGETKMQYWREKDTGRVYTMWFGKRDEWEPVVVLPVAEYERMRSQQIVVTSSGGDHDEVPEEVHKSGWQWRPVGDSAFAPPFGTIRVCVDCGCLVAGGPTRCVRCVRALEQKENPMDDGLVTLRVPRGSLEEALYWTRRGERWEHVDENRIVLLAVDKRHVVSVNDPLDGWHRVKEPLKCPACGYECTNTREDTRGNIQIVCDRCGVRGPVAVRESEAREAFRRMGGGR